MFFLAPDTLVELLARGGATRTFASDMFGGASMSLPSLQPLLLLFLLLLLLLLLLFLLLNILLLLLRMIVLFVLVLMLVTLVLCVPLFVRLHRCQRG